eukprot:SAG22_NODE_398_length_11106_cov_67.829836_2_plen_244_part_00
MKVGLAAGVGAGKMQWVHCDARFDVGLADKLHRRAAFVRGPAVAQANLALAHAERAGGGGIGGGGGGQKRAGAHCFLSHYAASAVARGGFILDPPVDDGADDGPAAAPAGAAAGEGEEPPEAHRLAAAEAAAVPPPEDTAGWLDDGGDFSPPPKELEVPEPADYGWRGARRAAHTGLRPYAPKTTAAHCLAAGEFTRVCAVSFALHGAVSHAPSREKSVLAMRCDAMRCDAMRCDAMRCDAMR